MESIRNQIENIKKAFDEACSGARSEQDVEHIRIQFIGREGLLAQAMSRLKELSVDEKRIVGPELNALRSYLTEAIASQRTEMALRLAEAKNRTQESFDVTAYRPMTTVPGSLHLYTTFIEEIEDIFLSMGFAVFDGPEVETDFYNFEALNIPHDHPARDMYDTLWLDHGHTLLRTHTSPVQIHALERYGAPLACVAPGRVYRHEAIDASHDAMFTQCEGLLVDRQVNLSHLFFVAQTFLTKLFDSRSIQIRMRPGFFPFVEPGVEIDMSCIFCSHGCSVCKKTGWIELCGAGLVHPHVLRAVKVDPARYTGFAFGFGVERLAMLRHGIDDIRLFHSGKLEFLKQF
jgi:phenylalanyl-tRNA synthetase alpha chain